MSLLLPEPQYETKVDPFAKIGRRGAPRLRLSIPAKLVSLYATHPSTVLDLSRTGARVRLDKPLAIGDGAFLQVGGVDHFASIQRQDETGNGLRFDVPLSDAQVLEIRRYSEVFEEDAKREWREVARNWVTGGR